MLRAPVGGGSGGDDESCDECIMVGSGASRATRPLDRVPSVAMREPAQIYDIRAADDRRVKHQGEKSVQFNLLDSSGVRG
eukprot:5746635-Pyramimonas_sp.AAC.1